VITVYGIPAPKGSKSFKGMRGGHAILVESSKKVKPWTEAVIAAVLAQTDTNLSGPVSVDIIFYLPRPKSTPKRVLYPAKKPDLDKLERSTWDALTKAGVIEDDARIVRSSASKRFAGCEHSTMLTPGAVIFIERVTK